MTGAFWPGLIVTVLLLAFWLDTYGIDKWRDIVAREQARISGVCVDCGDPLDRCTCVTFDPGDWFDE